MAFMRSLKVDKEDVSELSPMMPDHLELKKEREFGQRNERRH